MADSGDLTGCRRTSFETAPSLVKLSAPWLHPRAFAGGVWLARIDDFRRMANVRANRPDCAVCGELQSGLNRRLLN
jgi:hypothetical protein